MLNKNVKQKTFFYERKRRQNSPKIKNQEFLIVIELACIILDQTCLKPVEPRRLFVRKTTKGRPKQTKRKDFSYRIKYFFSIPTEQIKAKILMFLQGNIKIMP